MSVDMDEWYQCRWATGSEYAMWPDTKTFFKEYYGTDKPIGEIIPLTDKILDLFSSNNITATFFFTGEIASYYPDLVKKVAEQGHEIASHNYVHKDYNDQNKDEFYQNLKKSKHLLEKLSGQEVIGYRAPNSTISNYMIKDLIELGFKYDSSVTPTKPFMGKFGQFINAPLNPYELSEDDFAKTGNSGLWELPWPVFPIRSLPSGSGIMTRIAGYHYTKMSIDNALKTGCTTYYFHPYEIGPVPNVEGLNLKTRVFLRNLGDNFLETLKKIFRAYDHRFTNGAEILRNTCL
jgi:peptidoglycan/xylan/chitin deacetylase (PgdA/CDA1 family)